MAREGEPEGRLRLSPTVVSPAERATIESGGGAARRLLWDVTKGSPITFRSLRTRTIAAAVAFSAVAAPAVASLAAEEVPAPLQVAILLKVLIYDRTLATRAKDGLKLGVVHATTDVSRAAKERFVTSFNDSSKSVAGNTIDLQEITLDELVKESQGLDILYVCEGVDVDKVLEVAKKTGMITFAPDQDAVESGVVIGLVPRAGKPKLLINVPASIAAGMQLDPQILRLAELVKSK